MTCLKQAWNLAIEQFRFHYVILFEEMTTRYKDFLDMLERITKEVPEKPVFFLDDHGKKTVSWREFQTAVKQKEEELRIDPSTCVGIFCENTLACMIELFACNFAGKQIVMLDPVLPALLLKKQIQNTDVDMLWGNELRVKELQPFLTKGCTGGKGKILFFTSGTTSSAKAVVLSDASLMQSAWNGSDLLPLQEYDVLLDILPLHHVFGFVCGVLWGMSCKAAVALGRGPRHYLDDCAFYRPTAISVVPMLLEFFLKQDLINAECKLILIGAGDCPKELIDQVKKKEIRVSFGYGLTETSSGVALSLGEDPYALTVCKDDTIQIDESGEVLISAPTCMMQGYYKNDKDTKEVLIDHVLHTGDLGYFDRLGRLYIIGRKKEMLVLPDGTKIFLPEYEKGLKEFLHTDELAVILQDHRPVLILNELKEDEENILRKLEPFMALHPRGHRLAAVLSLHHPLPRTASGKIKHWEIQKEIQELWSKEKKS